MPLSAAIKVVQVAVSLKHAAALLLIEEATLAVIPPVPVNESVLLLEVLYSAYIASDTAQWDEFVLLREVLHN